MSIAINLTGREIAGRNETLYDFPLYAVEVTLDRLEGDEHRPLADLQADPTKETHHAGRGGVYFVTADELRSIVETMSQSEAFAAPQHRDRYVAFFEKGLTWLDDTTRKRQVFVQLN
jgi:hypothetical protein